MVPAAMVVAVIMTIAIMTIAGLLAAVALIVVHGVRQRRRGAEQRERERPEK